jgi:nucleotide-binding universal stress UspA family protein
MSRIEKIAVGVDFSPESLLAARQAAEVACHVGAELVLIHVAGTVELPAVSTKAVGALRESLEAWRAHLGEAIERDRRRLEELRGDLSGRAPASSCLLAQGLTDEGLCGAAEKAGADVTVVGTHGRTGLRWFLLGSVAQMVVRLARTDVLVARREGAGRGGFRRVLVATDLSPSAERALDQALAVAAPDATIEVVYFHGQLPSSDRADAPGLPWQALVEGLRARGEDMIAARRQPGGATLLFHTRSEQPIPGIVHWLEAHPFDLAVLGSHGRRGVTRALLGSVAEAVVRRAPCSVLVTRATAPGSR